jgi:hypothetical protein
MGSTYIQGEHDESGLTLKDHIWRFTCEFMATNRIEPEWEEVRRAVDLPTNASESKQKSHYRAAIHYMRTRELPSVHKMISYTSESL